ncbi:hypothetical protein G7Y79_00021g051050 [Physcia stellaris]|nr:hypothetical protein G7Y79_00021g051050 [Physcia stellaris]
MKGLSLVKNVFFGFLVFVVSIAAPGLFVALVILFLVGIIPLDFINFILGFFVPASQDDPEHVNEDTKRPQNTQLQTRRNAAYMTKVPAGTRLVLKKAKQKSSHDSGRPEPQLRSPGRSRQDTVQTLNSRDLDTSGTSTGVLHGDLLNPDQAKEEIKHRVPPGSVVFKKVKPTHGPNKESAPVLVQTDVEHTRLPANKLSPVFIQIDMEPTSSSLKSSRVLVDRARNTAQRGMLVDSGSGRAAEEEEASRGARGPAFFKTLPLEVRLIIYRYILTISTMIKRGADLVEQTTLGLIAPDEGDTSMILDIDATVLRTCRQMYAETLPILYGDNAFYFTNVRALDTFRKEGLATLWCEKRRYSMTPIFNLEVNHNGRLSMIRKLWLDLGLKLGTTPSRIMIQHEWGRFLHQNQYDSCNSDETWGFPSLEGLTLDFSDWSLKEDEGLITRPFVDKFRGPHGLRDVVILGVDHKKSLAQLKRGLLRECGYFYPDTDI